MEKIVPPVHPSVVVVPPAADKTSNEENAENEEKAHRKTHENQMEKQKKAMENLAALQGISGQGRQSL